MNPGNLLMSIALLSIAGCGFNFTSQYDRIEERSVRPLAFVYDNHGVAEAAPGDTVTLRMYFAGEPVQAIRLSATTSLVVNSFGTDTFADTFPLANHIVPGSYREYFGGTTDSAELQFVVPVDAISSQFVGKDSIGSLLPPGIDVSLLPESLRSVNPSEVIATIEAMGNGLIPVNAGMISDSLAAALPVLFQALTATMKIFATVNEHYRLESTYTIRYNSRFSALLPTLPVNHPPGVSWIRCYRVRHSGTFFDPVADSADIDTVFRIFPVTDSIIIATGFRYFLVADSGIASLDSGFSLTDPAHVRRPEEFRYEWFFENGENENRAPDSLMTLDNAFGGPSVELLPSLDTRVSRFNLWLVTRDRFLGEKLRPIGFDIRCVEGVFGYSGEYTTKHP